MYACTQVSRDRRSAVGGAALGHKEAPPGHLTEVRKRTAQLARPAWVADMFENDQLLPGAAGLYSLEF